MLYNARQLNIVIVTAQEDRMKLVISKAILENAIKTGGLAAFTEEGQRDDIRIKDATKSCVMLSVEERELHSEPL